MANPQDISILIVDDDPDLLESITSLFSIFGFKVDDATDGVSAFEKVKKNSYDIIITDINMPKMDGLELLKKIKKLNPIVPKVLLISGHLDYLPEDLFALGANGFFSKPFNATAVRDSLTQTILSKKEKWTTVNKRFGSQKIEKKFGSYKQAVLDEVFCFGQSGFYIHTEPGLLNKGEQLSFQIEFQEGLPFKKLTGIGNVVWSRDNGVENYKSGLGIMIDHLSEDCLDDFINWVTEEKIIPVIPKG